MAKPAANPVSAEDAKVFDAFVLKWQSILSLGDWRIERGRRPAAKGAMAQVEFDDSARLVTYKLGDFGAETINAQSLEKTAIHELLHVFLHDLITAAQDRSTTPEQMESSEHRCVNVLERLLADKP
jgi:hypothetical protein